MSGTLVPDITGDFELFGTHNGHDTFKLVGQEWYLWATSPTSYTWTASTVVGTDGTAWWERSGEAINGVYTPQGTATGVGSLIATP